MKADSYQKSREVSPRYSSLPVKDVLKIRMRDLGIKNTDLQKALGYPSPNVVAMMRQGSMRVPAVKAVVTAEMLKVDPVFLLGKIVAENDPELWDVISSQLGQQLISANELALIELIRRQLDGHDVDLTQEPRFRLVIEAELKVIAGRHGALARAAIERNDG